LPLSINMPPLPHLNDNTIFSSSSSTSTCPMLPSIARAITFARADAGSESHGVPVSRRGRTNSSPVLRIARSTASSPISSPMKVSNDVIQLIE